MHRPPSQPLKVGVEDVASRAHPSPLIICPNHRCKREVWPFQLLGSGGQDLPPSEVSIDIVTLSHRREEPCNADVVPHQLGHSGQAGVSGMEGVSSPTLLRRSGNSSLCGSGNQPGSLCFTIILDKRQQPGPPSQAKVSFLNQKSNEPTPHPPSVAMTMPGHQCNTCM